MTADEKVKAKLTEVSMKRNDTVEFIRPYKAQTTTSGKQPRTAGDFLALKKGDAKFKPKMLVVAKGTKGTILGVHVTIGTLIKLADGKEIIFPSNVPFKKYFVVNPNESLGEGWKETIRRNGPVPTYHGKGSNRVTFELDNKKDLWKYSAQVKDYSSESDGLKPVSGYLTQKEGVAFDDGDKKRMTIIAKKILTGKY